MVKQPPCMSATRSAGRAFLEISARSGQLVDALLVDVANHRNHQTVGVSTATPMWMYFFMISLLPSSDRALQKRGMGFQRLSGRLRMNTSGVIFHVQLLLLGQDVLLFAERFQIRGIGFELGDVGIMAQRCVAGQGPGDLLDGPFQLFDRAELAEINLRPGPRRSCRCQCRCWQPERDSRA